MSGRADVVCGSLQVACGPEHGSGVGPASQKELKTTTSWPLSSSLALGALLTAPSCARLHASAVLHEWGLSDVAETTELVVSELVTNAVQAATMPGGPMYDQTGAGLPVVHLRLLSDRVRVVIEVWDRNPQVPVAKQDEPAEERGRGLLLVEALCERWGWKVPPGWAGKVVWAELTMA